MDRLVKPKTTCYKVYKVISFFKIILSLIVFRKIKTLGIGNNFLLANIGLVIHTCVILFTSPENR